jgi:hypothetical protein
MKIPLSPMRSDSAIKVIRDGDALIINEVRLDFTDLAPGSMLEGEQTGSPWILGDLTRDA